MLSIRIPLFPFLPKSSICENKVLLVRDDVIGDLIVPTSATVNWLLSNGYDVYLVLRENLFEIGKLMLPEDKLILIDMHNYRNSLSYRYSFLKTLRHIGFKHAIGSTIHSTINNDIVRNSGSESKWGYRRSISFKERWKLRGIETVSTYPLFEDKRYSSVLKHEEHFLEFIFKKAIDNLRPTAYIKNEEPLVSGKYIHYICDAGNIRRVFPFEKLIETLIQIAEKLNYKVVLTGLKEVKYIHKSCINLTGKTSLVDVLNIVSNASYVIGSESGITHLAWVIKKDTVMFYGAGHYGRFYPEGNTLILTNNAEECACCDWNCIYSDELFRCVNIANSVLKEKLESFIV